MAGLIMVGYVFRHISQRPVGWASTNSDGVEDQGAMLVVAVFGGAVALHTFATARRRPSTRGRAGS